MPSFYEKHWKMRALFVLLFLLIVHTTWSQTRIGAWRDHLPYQSCKKVVQIGTKYYCATDYSIFTYDTKDNSLQKLTKVTGLSDIGIATMEYYQEKNVLLIAYSNGNIDLLKGQTIINIPNLYRQSMTGSKVANHIFFRNNFAYISYPFGVVVLDIVKYEIKDTYQVGEDGSIYEVLATTADDNYFYAATAKGLFKGGVNNQFLVDPAQWQRDLTIPNNNGKFNVVTVFNGKVVANSNGSNYATDTLYYLDNGWHKFLLGEHLGHYELHASGNQLVVTGQNSIYYVNSNFQMVQSVKKYSGFTFRDGIDYPDSWSSCVDGSGNLWTADKNYGLVMIQAGTSNCTSIYPNGPKSNHVGQMQYYNGTIYASAGGTTARMAPLGFGGEINQFSNEAWSTISKSGSFDFTAFAIDPTDNQKIYAGSWGGGVYVFNKDEMVEHYTDQNSPFKSNLPGLSSFCIGGVTFDANNNLWIAQGGVSAPLSILKTDKKTWSTLSWNAIMGTSALGEILFDQYNQIWIPLLPDHGIFVADFNGTIDNEKDDKVLIFNPISAYNETITRVVCATSDRSGYVWLGTDHGPVYYPNPQNVFNGETAGTKVLIPRNDGKNTVDPLLGSETINTIVVDGADRKWFGTLAGGAFLTSSDGTKQIVHFNMSNSPLPSNNVLSIAINDKTGEVFFGTDKGIFSYRSDATKPGDDFTNVYVFPNPIRENYSGPITITGLIENTIVKITDVSGNLVYQTKSAGGQASWNGVGHNGRRVATGIYLVFCSNEDGSKTFVTKMLVIH